MPSPDDQKTHIITSLTIKNTRAKDKNKSILFVLLLSLIPHLRFQCTVWNVFFHVAKFYSTDLQHNVQFHYTFLNDLTLRLAVTKPEPSIFRNSSREKWQNTQLKWLWTIGDRSIEMFLNLNFSLKKMTCYRPLFTAEQYWNNGWGKRETVVKRIEFWSEKIIFQQSLSEAEDKGHCLYLLK